MKFDLLTPEGLRNLKVVIVGAGVTGRALANFVLRYGADLTLFDERAKDSSRTLPDLFDLAIISPGWKPDHPILTEIRSRGVTTVSELDFAWQMKSFLAPNQRWFAVTGTNGKTTTVQMVESILKKGGRAALACGNVGRTVIESISPDYEILAIELSSFQIHWSERARFEAIAILNISPDHIDWHGSFDAYRDAKLKLMAHADRSLINLSDATLSRAWPELLAHGSRELIPFHLGSPASGEIGLVEDLIVDRALVADPLNAEVLTELSQLPSRAPHNVSNAMAAAALAKLMGVDGSAIESGLADFVIDQHRLQQIGEFSGVTWVDDSKATNPHAAMASIFSFPSVIWIAGGLAKGADMEELVRATASRIRAAIVIGTDGELIRSALERAKPGVKVVSVAAELKGEAVMREVVKYAKNLASRGDTVLLAPACASMDQFTSYAERGDLFQKSVRELVTPGSGE